MKSAYRAELTCAVQLRISDQNAWSRVGTEDDRCNATRITSLLFSGDAVIWIVSVAVVAIVLLTTARPRSSASRTVTLCRPGLMPVVFQLIAVRRLPSVGGSMAP